MRVVGMRIKCDVDEVELDGDHCPVEGVMATCHRCGHETESYGTGEGSVSRCLVLLREECPKNERNYYEEGVRYGPQPRQPLPNVQQWRRFAVLLAGWLQRKTPVFYSLADGTIVAAAAGGGVSDFDVILRNMWEEEAD